MSSECEYGRFRLGTGDDVPRPHRPRSIASEDHLARRIAYERERHGWSYAGLAQRLTAVGCAIDGSALYKIEKGSPRRRISVDELVALSDVFGVPVAELLVPPELHAERRVLEALEEYRRLASQMTELDARISAIVAEVSDLLSQHPDAERIVREVFPEEVPVPVPTFGGLVKTYRMEEHGGEHQAQT